MCNYVYFTHISDIEPREIDRYTGRKEAVIESSLSPWSIYEFRVASGNELGYGVPSAPSPQYNTPPDRPYRAPFKIGGGGGKIGDLTITWEVRVIIDSVLKHVVSVYFFNFDIPHGIGNVSSCHLFCTFSHCHQQIRMDQESTIRYFGVVRNMTQNSSLFL